MPRYMPKARRLWRRFRCGRWIKPVDSELVPITDRNRWIAIRSRFTNDPQPKFYGGEYDKLCQDPRVARIVVDKNGNILLITTRVITKLVTQKDSGNVYLGTYLVSVSITHPAEPVKYVISCIDSGRHDAMLRPRYHNPGVDEMFCFGSARAPFIKELATSGEFFSFFTIVLDSVWHVNREDYDDVLERFRKVAHDATIEPCCKKPNEPNSSLGG
jgi:hypothetical protein